jgi:hypothetical protein
MVFQKQKNNYGNYVDKKGERYDILSCERTESKQWRQIGTETQEIDGETVEVPIMEEYIAINYGWDKYDSEEVAAIAYGLMLSPLPEGEEENAH